MKKFSLYLKETTTRDEFPTQQEVFSFLSKQFPKIPKWQSMDTGYAHYGLHSSLPDERARKILLCVTPGYEIEEYAKKNGYDLIVSHHPGHVCSIPIMSFHLPMDFGTQKSSQNKYFAFKMGLQNVKMIGDSYVYGVLPRPLTLNELKTKLRKAGYPILTGRHEYSRDTGPISTVVFIGGLGQIEQGLDSKQYPTLQGVFADAYVTGQISHAPRRYLKQFRNIIEIGHTASERPIFRWIRNIIRNRWQNVQVDLAPLEIDTWGDE